MKGLKLLIRICASPFVLGLLIITYNFMMLHRFYLFIRYGGEFANYEKDDKTTIHDIYLILKEERGIRKKRKLTS